MTSVSAVVSNSAPCSLQFMLECGGVGQIAVVGDRQRDAAQVLEQRLGVGQDRAAGRGVAGVTDGDIAEELGEAGLGEILRDQPHPPVGTGLALFVHRDDPGALLAPVLQGVEAEVGEARRVRDAGDSEDSAHAIFPFQTGRGLGDRGGRPRPLPDPRRDDSSAAGSR